MSVRSFLIFVAAFSILFTLIAEDASARGRRCKKRMSQCGTSRSSSWGGSYGSVGSCGTPIVVCCPKPCSVVASCNSSFGSTGGCGGAYTSAGSSGGWVMPAAEVIHQPAPVIHHHEAGPHEVIVPEFGTEGGSVIEKQPAEHEHIHTDASTDSAKTTDQSVTSRVAATSEKHAYLVLRNVPVDAEIYLLGVKMTARGALRRYRIPVAASEQEYDYKIELKLPTLDHQPAISETKVRSGETTELWVAEAGDQVVFVDQQSDSSDSIPLAIR